MTRGQRLVIVGWVQSLIARPDQRKVLIDIDRAIDELSAQELTEALNLLAKTRSNLLRQWVDC